MTDNPSISARHDAALEGIAAAGREIAAAIRGFHDTAALAKEATVLARRAADHERRMGVLENETLEALNTAERERDEARAEVERLRAAAPVRPGDDSARLLWDGTYWYAERDVQEARRLREELQAEVEALRAIGRHIRKIWTSPSKEVRELLDAVDVLTEQAQDARPQIDASVPAEQPQGESGGSGSTGAVTEAARVLGEHYPDQTSYDAGDLHGCHCGWEVPRPRTSDDGDWTAYWAHQAEGLAKAGLLVETNEEGA